MADEKQLVILRQGVETWNEWRKQNPDENINLDGANFLDTNLAGVNLRSAYLIGACLRRADLSKADLAGAMLSGADLIASNLGGANLWGTYLNGAYLNWANLSEASLTEAHLINAHLNSANLHGASLTVAVLMGADLTRADLSDSHLCSANLQRAILVHADLSNADLTGVNLHQADLSSAILMKTTLRETNFTSAIICDTIFGDVDISAARGLDHLEHRGTSTVGIDTFYKSQRKISQTFLKATGAPSHFVTIMLSPATQLIEGSIRFLLRGLVLLIYAGLYVLWLGLWIFIAVNFGVNLPILFDSTIWLIMILVLGFVLSIGVINLISSKVLGPLFLNQLEGWAKMDEITSGKHYPEAGIDLEPRG